MSSISLPPLPVTVIHHCSWSERENVLDTGGLVQLAIWHKVLTEKSARRLVYPLSEAYVRSLIGQISRQMWGDASFSDRACWLPWDRDRIWVSSGKECIQQDASGPQDLAETSTNDHEYLSSRKRQQVSHCDTPSVVATRRFCSECGQQLSRPSNE